MIGVLVSGEGTNLQALLDAGLPVSAVASNVPGVRALGRAEAAHVSSAVFPLDDYSDRATRDAAMADWLVNRGVRLVVCAGYMQLLSPAFLARFGGRTINTHPALLPSFPGVHGPRDALAHGVKVTGATLFLIDEGVDTGRILAQEPVRVLPDDTVESLHERIKIVERQLLVDTVNELSRGIR